MPAWLMPTLRAIAPHIGTIISATMPVFTKKSDEAAANQAALLQQQITELQSAAADNAAHIRELAAQMQKTVTALEEGASLVERRFRRTVLTATALSAVACIAALGAVVYVVRLH